MKRENIRNLENHVIAATIGFVIAYVVGAQLFGYGLPDGILSSFL